LLLRRDLFGLFWLLAFPLIFALFFGSIFGGSGGGGGSLRVALVDQDGSDASRAFTKALEDTGSVRFMDAPEGTAMTEDRAKDAVRTGDTTAAIVIPKGFGDASGLMFTPDPPELRVAIDPARRAEAGMLEGLIIQASFERMKTAFVNPRSMLPDIRKAQDGIDADQSMDPAQRAVLSTFYTALESFFSTLDTPSLGDATSAPAFEPVRIVSLDIARDRRQPANPFEVSFPQAMVWGLIGCAAGFAIGLVQERTQGTWLRLRIAPQSRAQILAGKGLSCFLTCLIAVGLMLLLGNLIFGVRVVSPALLLAAVVSSALCFTGLMMLISTLGRTERAVAGAGWAAMMPLAMLGGAMVPLFVMPQWMQTVGSVSPVKWAIMSLEGAIWRGFSPSEMLLPCTILIGVGVIGYGIGVTMLLRGDT
jgi:ABC-2 type transport system permease protein